MIYITYVDDLDLLRSEIEQQKLKGTRASRLLIKEDGKLNIKKAAIFKRENQSLGLVKSDDVIFKLLPRIKILGECINGEYIFNREECKAIYESVRQPNDETPYKIGVFYGI